MRGELTLFSACERPARRIKAPCAGLRRHPFGCQGTKPSRPLGPKKLVPIIPTPRPNLAPQVPFPEGSAIVRVPAKRGFRVREARGGAKGAGKGPPRPARTCSQTDAEAFPGIASAIRPDAFIPMNAPARSAVGSLCVNTSCTACLRHRRGWELWRLGVFKEFSESPPLLLSRKRKQFAA